MEFKKWKAENYSLNNIINGNNIEIMNNIQDVFSNKINLIITSPPYNVGINYDKYNDSNNINQYFKIMKETFTLLYNLLANDGRLALNIPYEVNMQKNGGRVFIVSEYWQMLKEIGFQFAGIVDLSETNPHRSKLTSFGSWLKGSAPYIYNPKECVLICYKNEWKRVDKKSIFSFPNTDEGKKEFMNLVFGQWKYFAQTKKLTEANFSLDIPINALKILSYEGDIVLDPFMGSGQTAIACKKYNRNYIGFELSKDYCDIAEQRIKDYNYDSI
jgi:site-specific DNA-methyltransferase (adenine-specific)